MKPGNAIVVAAAALCDAARMNSDPSPEPKPAGETAPAWRAVLAKIPLFSGFSPEQLERLGVLAHERRVRRGEVLMRTGDPGLFMMIVTAGEVRVMLAGQSGHEQTLSTLGRGAVIGEIALFDGQTRTADVVAATNGKVLVIERAATLRLLAQDPHFALGVITGLCARLRSTLGQLEAMVFEDVATRLASCLLRLAQGKPPRRLDMTQAALGQLVGASREIVNKRLRALAAEGLVKLSPGRVELLDEAGLSAMIRGRTGK